MAFGWWFDDRRLRLEGYLRRASRDEPVGTALLQRSQVVEEIRCPGDVARPMPGSRVVRIDDFEVRHSGESDSRRHIVAGPCHQVRPGQYRQGGRATARSRGRGRCRRRGDRRCRFRRCWNGRVRRLHGRGVRGAGLCRAGAAGGRWRCSSGRKARPCSWGAASAALRGGRIVGVRVGVGGPRRSMWSPWACSCCLREACSSMWRWGATLLPLDGDESFPSSPSGVRLFVPLV